MHAIKILSPQHETNGAHQNTNLYTINIDFLKINILLDVAQLTDNHFTNLVNIVIEKDLQNLLRKVFKCSSPFNLLSVNDCIQKDLLKLR